MDLALRARMADRLILQRRLANITGDRNAGQHQVTPGNIDDLRDRLEFEAQRQRLHQLVAIHPGPRVPKALAYKQPASSR